MRILLCSHVFPPQIGGIETVSAILADQWTRLGSIVTVVTQTLGKPYSQGYEVIRRPSLIQLRDIAKRSDLIFQNNVSLRTLVPLLTLGKPVVITHQGMIIRENGKRGWREHLKCRLLRHCTNISISAAVAKHIPVESAVIGNPFESDEFAFPASNSRPKDLVFMGRLVSDKGCDLVLHALSILKNERIRPTFTVIGDGPEMPTLSRMAAEMGLSDQVTFKGVLRGGRGREIAQHKIMVIPSVWAEPFGVVALEGLAAGCVVVASKTGGLPEAVGSCGLLFPGSDVQALASAIKRLLSNSSLREELVLQSGRHLASFLPETIAKQYLDIFESLLRN